MFKVSTWNVNSIGVRLNRLIGFLDREKPDVLCLQELKCTDDKFPREVLTTLGYSAAVHGQKTYNGVAILAKKPLENVQLGMADGVEDAAARFVSAYVNGIQVFCLYVPNGQEVGSEKYQYKLAWLSRLEEILKKNRVSQRPSLLCGDFNIAPEDRDVHNPKLWEEKILCSTPERTALRKIQGLGFQDTLRLHQSEAGLYSWWDYRQGAFPRNLGLRIDLILADPSLSEKCTQVSIDREERKGVQPSDHVPVTAHFDL